MSRRGRAGRPRPPRRPEPADPRLRGDRLGAAHGPLRTLCSAAPWRASGYLASYLVTGPALFAVALTAVLVGVVLSLFSFTVLLVAGSAWAVRCCAQVERGRAVLVADPIPYRYRDLTGLDLTARLPARLGDAALGRDCACLILLFPVLLLLDAVALLVWLVLLAGVSLPLWFHAVDSTRADGTVTAGVRFGPVDGPALWIDGWPAALGAALLCLLLAALWSRPLVAAARLHLRVARTLLRPPTDPLAPAKRVLAEPGPLAALRHG
ncbi:sensor domain-containing protein [Kitasatospora sp. NPDC093806]|uniref:sensor domain-containing protein n=1 Tax=Kitasatospora sp. NPDC093806 TaxID=3155075 RepID=UPI00342E27E3